MNKIRLMLKNEDVQARLVIIGFVIIFGLMTLFFL